MTTWRGVLLSVLLSFVPIHASAECAWVLWVEDKWIVTYRKDQQPPTWTYVESHQIRPACEQAQDAKIKLLSDNGDVQVHGNIVSRKFGESITRNLRVVCAPDTIDPRGAKGR